MQSHRALGTSVLLVLAAAAVAIGWFVFSGGDTAIAPAADPAAAHRASAPPATAEAGGADAAAANTEATGPVREAVVASGPTASSLPSITGQVVGTDQHPIADAEVICIPGVAFTPDFENLDAGDTDVFDPQAITDRLRGQVRDRVTVRSDADGRFRVRVEGTSRTVSLRVLARGHLVLDRSVPRPNDADTDLGLLVLADGAVVEGRVLDAQGSPIEGARVSRLLDFEKNLPAGMDFAAPEMAAMDDLRSGETDVTDTAGHFELAHVEAGDFTLRARHAEHPTAQRTGLTVAGGQTLSDVVVTMPRGAQIRGVVVGIPEGVKGLSVMASPKPEAGNDPSGGLLGMLGDPLEFMAEAGFAMGERKVPVEADGSFVLRGLKADSTYRLWVAQQGRGFAGAGICSARVEAPSGGFGVELRYEAGVTVTFVVVDARSGEPIERLWVRDELRGGGGFADMMAFAPNNARSKAYPEGRVTVANLRPKKDQTLQLTIDALGHAQQKREGIALPVSGSLDLGTLKLEPRPVLRVTVAAAENGRAIAGARVELRPKREGRGADNPFAALAQGARSSPRSGQTDSKGQCTLNVLDGEVGELQVRARGLAPFVAEVAMAPSGDTEQQVRLLAGGSAEVTVLGADRQPVKDANVEHRTPAGDVDRQRTDASGLARFATLAPGAHEFRLADDLGPMGFAMDIARRRAGGQVTEAAWQSVEIKDRAVATLSIEKNPAARLRGIVRENGLPLAGARVAFRQGPATDGADALTEGIMGDVMGRMGGGSKHQTKTGDDGRYEFAELPPGAHRLRVTHGARAMPTDLELTLREGDNQFDVDLDMTSLRGVVLDPSGKPVEGATVTVQRAPEAAGTEDAAVSRALVGMMPGLGLGGPTQKSDGAGAFELRGVDPDVALQVQATAKGFAPAVAAATVARGRTQTGLELRLIAAGRIKVTVTESAPFAAVSAKFVGDGAASVAPVMRLLNRGKGTLDGLRPGQWQVEYRSMNDRDKPPATRTVDVVAGETIEIEF
ncbi:MAG TPA: carboxypeptidase-like regulatory domain-containing protein [Planctomycetota bacterium]|nr:carboxypeptidase-like regulatory domain-containing protein [Planctomycetota bacterium]